MVVWRMSIGDQVVSFTNGERVVSAHLPRIANDNSYVYAGSKWVGIYLLLPPLVYEYNNKLVIRFYNARYTEEVKPGRLIYLTDFDRALLRKAFGVKLPNIVSSKELSEMNLDFAKIKSDLSNLRMYRVIDVKERLKAGLSLLQYVQRLDISDVQRVIIRQLTGPLARLDKDQPVARLALRRQIMIPNLPDRVYIKGMEYYIDTLSTPQNDKSGMIVTLAKDAKVVGNRLKKGTSIFSDHLASVIAFPHILKPERVPIIHATVTQSVRVKADEEPLVVPRTYKKIVSGVNVFMTYIDSPYTSNDSIIISESLADRLESEEYTYQRELGSKLVPVVDEGDEIYPGQVVAVDGNREIRAKVHVKAKVVKITETEVRTTTGYMDAIIIEYLERYKTRLGSKLAGLHSNKHTVGLILPDSEMPYVEGIGRVGAIVSPSTVGKRKNLSLIAEGAYGHTARKIGQIVVEPFNGRTLYDELEVAKEMADEFLDYPVSKSFVFDVQWKGRTIRTFVGYHFITRLHHHPERKMSFSSRLNTDGYGRSRYGDGMQRLGMNEIEALISVGRVDVLKDLRAEQIEKTMDYDYLYDALSALDKIIHFERPDVFEDFAW